MTDYRPSDTLIKAVKQFEGLRLKAYRCPAGILTIGYGHTRGVKAGQQITKAQADSLLNGDLLPAVQYVNTLGVCKTQGQFDALVDFAYNLGTAALASSTLLKRIRLGSDDAAICKELRKWVYAGGKLLPGLQKRREWECLRWQAKH